MGGLTITARISRLSREGSDHGFQEEVSHYPSRELAGRRMGHTFTARIDNQPAFASPSHIGSLSTCTAFCLRIFSPSEIGIPISFTARRFIEMSRLKGKSVPKRR